jgi:2-oxoisovalerate dehydrogenase E1 component alpha subunit
VTIVYFGDGATSKGDFHEGLNFAGIHKLPIVFVCEDNGYAISVPHNRQMAIQDVADRAAGYGFPGVVVDGNDVLAVYGIAKEGIERARGGGGPTLIEAKTYRLMPHSSDDDDRRYRSQEEVEEWRRKDPILRFRSYLEGKAVLPEVREQEIRERVIREIDEAVAYAVNSPYPDPVGLFDNLYCV